MSASHEVADHATLARTMVERPSDVLLLDLALPGLGGVSGVPAIRRLSRSTKIVVLTSASTENEGAVVLMAGASGYCPKKIDSALLRKAVKVVQRGELWVSRSLTYHLFGELGRLTDLLERAAATEPDSRLEALTSRQQEIVKLLADGARNQEIARRFNITERTVKSHLTAVFRKLGVSGRLRLALLTRGRRIGLESPSTLGKTEGHAQGLIGVGTVASLSSRLRPYLGRTTTGKV